MIARPTQFGFSLVELSIVLVILGLLTGGILGGQALIRAAELRAVPTEHARWMTATQTFRDKYFALPGDMTNATRFWGRAASATDCVTNSGGAVTSPSAGTCDGNGNGAIERAIAPGLFGENFLFWQHLARAALVEGTFSGQTGPGSGFDAIFGINVPRSRLQSAGWTVHTHHVTVHPGGTTIYTYVYGNMLLFGAPTSNTVPRSPILRPDEAWNIDVKIDDGRPAYGKILAVNGSAWGSADSCTTSASESDYNGAYRLDNNAISCSFIFPNIF